jgi:gamma-glutamyltranspeptidase / glutathione hydrolase
VGELLRFADFAATLERIAEEGTSFLYRGDVARAICEIAPQIAPDDLGAYRVITRRPVTTTFRGDEFVSNPPPSSGGVLIAYGLRRLEEKGRFGARELLATMRDQAAARDRLFESQLYRGGLAKRLVEAPSMTTHISVVDAAGNAASLSCSTGSGSGVVVPGTGVQLNNMLGEFDLAQVGRTPKPGVRFTSGMGPSIVLRDGLPRLVVGSAGSMRLRGAIFQIVVDVVGHGLGVEEAIERPRVHFDDPHVQCEGGNDPAELDQLETWGYDLVRWRRRNLYFGGVAGVEFRADGTLAAAGDPRRGGHGLVVE